MAGYQKISASRGIDKVLLWKTGKKFWISTAIACDAIALTKSIYDDYKYKTTRNITEAVSICAIEWSGTFAGSIAGIACVSGMNPENDPFVASCVGAMIGSAAGSIFGRLLVNYVLNVFHYDAFLSECENCDCVFRIKLYMGEDEDEVFCSDCRSKLLTDK